jgi:hypothetical protein
VAEGMPDEDQSIVAEDTVGTVSGL